MDIQVVMRDFKARFDVVLAAYLDDIIRDAREKDVFVAEALEYTKTMIMAGGKRLRPIMMYYGYKAVGGRDEDAIMRAAISIELIHSFLLIHDDIMDRDHLRHGIGTLHSHYGALSERLFSGVDHRHFGNSMALIVGDMIGALGNQVLFDAAFDPKLILRALSKLQSIIALTVVGQTRDVYIEYAKRATEDEILRMYEYKTARYTVEGPLHLGAILGGGDPAILEGLSRYAIPLGIAFQIQDDILGIFGSEEKLGKPVGSDIQEGKWTLLVSRATEMLAADEKKDFLRILGKGENLTSEDIDRFRELVRRSGSLEYARALATDSISTGRQAMVELKGIVPDAQEFLVAVADFMMLREH